jgi:hypothetical protein
VSLLSVIKYFQERDFLRAKESLNLNTIRSLLFENSSAVLSIISITTPKISVIFLRLAQFKGVSRFASAYKNKSK